MIAKPDIPGVEFGPMEMADRDAVADLVAATFSRYEPMAVAAGQSFAPIGGLIDRLEDWYRAAKAPQAGECLDLAILAVERSHGGQGIAQNLVSICVENGAAKGFRRAITMATNRTSQRVFQKLGFIELFSVSYKDYTFDGNRVFASIETDDRAALMEREL